MIEWINEYFGINNDVSVPIVVTLIIFITGGLISYVFIWLKNLFKRKQLRKTLLFLIARTEYDLKSQEKNLHKFYKALNVEDKDNLNLTYSSIGYIDTFFELDFNEIYSAYRKRFFWRFWNRQIREKAFHIIWETLRNIRYIETRIEPDFRFLNSKLNEHHNKYNDSMTSLRKFFDDTRRDHQGKEVPVKFGMFIKKLDKIWLDWTKLDEKERVRYFVTYNQIVKPTWNLISKYPNLPIIKQMDLPLLNCMHQFNQMDSLLNSYKELFHSHYIFYRKSRKRLNKASKIL